MIRISHCSRPGQGFVISLYSLFDFGVVGNLDSLLLWEHHAIVDLVYFGLLAVVQLLDVHGRVDKEASDLVLFFRFDGRFCYLI